MTDSAPTVMFSEKLLNTIDALIVVLDLEGRIVFVNSAFVDLMGVPVEEAVGSFIWDAFLLPEEMEGVKTVFFDLGKSEENSRYTNNLQTATGGNRLISWSNTCLFQSDGTLQFIVGTGSDITDQSAVMLALEEREAKLQSIITAASDCIIIADVNGIIEQVNPAVESLFGYSADDLVGCNVSLLMPEPDRSLHNGYISDYLQTNRKQIIGIGREVYAQHKDGHTFPIHLSLSESHYDHKTLFTGIIRDLTERNLQEEKLRHAYKAEAIGQLTSGIAHDFNNLLTIMLGNLEMLEPHLQSSEVSEILNEIFDAVEQGRQLIKELLTFGRRQSLKKENININRVVEKTAGLLHRTLPGHIELVTNLQSDLWNCYVDEAQVENALINMIINARDAMSEGGTVVVETANIEDGAKMSGLLPGAYIVLSVADNGIGMPPEVKKHACDPFFTKKGGSLGTGLGLSMVHSFVTQSSGTMVIESEVALGTTVSIYLPKAIR